MRAPEGFANAVAYICAAAVAIFIIQCAQKESEKGRCVTWTNGTITCSGNACEHCKAPERP